MCTSHFRGRAGAAGGDATRAAAGGGNHGTTEGAGGGWDARAAVRHYAAASVVCAVFAAVYEHLSHGVYSPFMIGMFAFPLAMGVLPAYMATRLEIGVPSHSAALWACATATLAVGSAMTGVFEIYGSSSPLVLVYWAVGGALAAAALFTALGTARPWRR